MKNYYIYIPEGFRHARLKDNHIFLVKEHNDFTGIYDLEDKLLATHSRIYWKERSAGLLRIKPSPLLLLVFGGQHE